MLEDVDWNKPPVDNRAQMISKAEFRKASKQPGVFQCTGFGIVYKGERICMLTQMFMVLLGRSPKQSPELTHGLLDKRIEQPALFDPASAEELTRYFATCGFTVRGFQELRGIGRRMEVAKRLFVRDDLEPEQAVSIFLSLIHAISPLASGVLSHYRAHAEQAHKACEELLQTKTKRQTPAQPMTDDEQLCICCLDSPRSLVYKPCGHRVCCEDCAVALWAKAQTCPWCRASCEEL